jgi:hypothetical protein
VTRNGQREGPAERAGLPLWDSPPKRHLSQLKKAQSETNDRLIAAHERTNEFLECVGQVTQAQRREAKREEPSEPNSDRFVRACGLGSAASVDLARDLGQMIVDRVGPVRSALG